jgi:hypothetical protein
MRDDQKRLLTGAKGREDRGGGGGLGGKPAVYDEAPKVRTRVWLGCLCPCSLAFYCICFRSVYLFVCGFFVCICICSFGVSLFVVSSYVVCCLPCVASHPQDTDLLSELTAPVLIDDVPDWRKKGQNEGVKYGKQTSLSMKDQKESLPIFKYKDDLLQAIKDNQILIVVYVDRW